MGSVRETIIKPPMERVKSGKVFRPTKALRNKYILNGLIVSTIFWILAMISWVGFGYLILTDKGISPAQYWNIIGDWWLTVNIGYWLVALIWIVPALILIPIYVKRIEYSVIAESGETMPEIYVRKGIVTITEKHVPFRTITNIASKAGPFDRLMGIGSVEIQTAGITSGTQPGSKPEERIEGIPFFEEVRDFILQELRKFHRPYVTGTEVDAPQIQQTKSGELESTNEVLEVLREIRDLLREER
jgi:membrane protein YdbS with pleckstrin-like domain